MLQEEEHTIVQLLSTEELYPTHSTRNTASYNQRRSIWISIKACGSPDIVISEITHYLSVIATIGGTNKII